MSVIDEYANVGYVNIKVKREDMHELAQVLRELKNSMPVVNPPYYNNSTGTYLPSGMTADILQLSQTVSTLTASTNSFRYQMDRLVSVVDKIVGYNI